MNKFIIKFYASVLPMFILVLHILGFVSVLYLPNYFIRIIWLLTGCIDVIFILKLGKLAYSCHKSMFIDTLTQLNNREFFYASISDSMKKLQKNHTCISLLIIDLDNFKDINDMHGHIAGDEILKQLSTILKHSIRTTDIAARWGGDEFVITLPGVITKDAFNIADRIRIDIHNHDFFYNNLLFKVTASIGVASIGNKMDINSFIELADQALYKAKTSKDSVVFLDGCVNL